MLEASPNDPIDPSLRDVLALFEGPLQEVTFPDVDSASLAELADDVRAAADEVAQAAALLETSRAALQGRREALLGRAQRALAYARIYAADKPELSAAIDRIALPQGRALAALDASQRSLSPNGPRKRGRPRKIGEPTGLFGAGIEAEASATAAE